MLCILKPYIIYYSKFGQTNIISNKYVFALLVVRGIQKTNRCVDNDYLTNHSRNHNRIIAYLCIKAQTHLT